MEERVTIMQGICVTFEEIPCTCSLVGRQLDMLGTKRALPLSLCRLSMAYRNVLSRKADK